MNEVGKGVAGLVAADVEAPPPERKLKGGGTGDNGDDGRIGVDGDIGAEKGDGVI